MTLVASDVFTLHGTPLRENNTVSESPNPLFPSKQKISGQGGVSVLQPTAISATQNQWLSLSSLSNSHTVTYNDLSFGVYVPYRTDGFKASTQVSRNIYSAYYSPY